MPSGASVFAADCASCHQIDGEGSPGAFPPLAGNPVVTGDPSKVIHIVKYGLSGPLQVAGKQYSGMMPAWNAQISDAEIAAAITYIRRSWGNSATPVTADQVSAVAK
ncbi:MAG TPA: cytochrome c [Candidatus Baltobacteraceae bacterium]|nr:cytochrome c [Candidatus Baltobacteraceae bacterium]